MFKLPENFHFIVASKEVEDFGALIQNPIVIIILSESERNGIIDSIYGAYSTDRPGPVHPSKMT